MTATLVQLTRIRLSSTRVACSDSIHTFVPHQRAKFHCTHLNVNIPKIVKRGSAAYQPFTNPLAVISIQRESISGLPCARKTVAFSTTAGKMSTDDDYMAFLNKANEDPNQGYASTEKKGGSTGELKTKDAGAQVPAGITAATKDAFYISDADEPFIPVCLKWNEAGKGLPDEEDLARLIGHPDPATAEIQILDPADWDPKGQHAKLLEAIRDAGKGNDVRVYKLTKDGTRVEYWLITREGDGEQARIVGAKALAVES